MTDEFNKLITVLRTRREYCRAMLELARTQQTLIAENRTTDLLQLIAQKQRVIAGLSTLAEEFGGLAEHWKSIRNTLPDTDRAACDAILSESESLLAQTLQHESHGTAALNEHRNRTRAELQELGELAQTTTTPGLASQTPEPQFLDVSR